MKTTKATYTDKSNFALPNWMKLQHVCVLKSSFLAVYEAEVDDKNGIAAIMLIRLEYPKRLLRKFKKHFGLS